MGVEAKPNVIDDPKFRSGDAMLTLDELDRIVPIEPSETPPPKDCFAIDDAPRDGKHVYLKSPEGLWLESYWRHTRRFDKNGGVFRPVGFWAMVMPINQPVRQLAKRPRVESTA